MLNVLSMVGRLTRDPELRQTNSGNPVGSFTIACDDRPGPNGEKQVVFLNCTIFGKGADVLAKFFKKGNLIAISGRLTQRKYTNKNGVEVTATECVVNQIEFVESSSDREKAQAQETPIVPTNAAGAQTTNAGFVEIPDDQLPF